MTYDLGWIGPLVTIAWILAVTNAFNLVDGLDGLAGGLVAIAAATCALVLIARGQEGATRMLVALVGATAGFLAYNLYLARIFLGDSGSLLAGFLLAPAGLPLAGSRRRQRAARRADLRVRAAATRSTSAGD